MGAFKYPFFLKACPVTFQETSLVALVAAILYLSGHDE
jgi:hypothetical protein